MLDPERYFPIDRRILAARLVEVAHNLCELYEQRRAAVIEERRLRFHTFQTTLETSVAARDRAADIESYAQWVAVQDINTQIQDCTEERELIKTLLELEI